MKCVLSIAGSDSGGGAGIQADIKTITSLGAHALTVITALTAQNSLGVSAIHPVPPGFIARQIKAVVEDRPPDSVKVGMVFTAAAVKAVSRMITDYALSPVVVDPVFRASTGRLLLEPGAIRALKEHLLPLATVVTPNLDEAEILTGKRVRTLKEMERAALEIFQMGSQVVIKGGHLERGSLDVFFDGKEVTVFPGKKIVSTSTHGTGCVFSSALATFLALGRNSKDAVQSAHDMVRKAIRQGYPVGRGLGAVAPYFSESHGATSARRATILGARLKGVGNRRISNKE
jgi:hydroxymethylpyrimidine/phosphomethylpyrimidine kinase